jgi:uncharacterized membrane protein
MRQAVKFLHTIASCLLVGGLGGYAIILLRAPQGNAPQMADVRQTIAAICDLAIIPSLGVALVSGLVSILVHRPYQEKRWVWLKALFGLSLFEATLAITQAKATSAAMIAAQIAAGAAQSQALADVLDNEWTELASISALCVAQVALGVWRPALRQRAARPSRDGLRAIEN